MKILVINGPNLNLLGDREPEIYGRLSYQGLIEKIARYAEGKGAEVGFAQHNGEEGIIEALHAARGNYSGIALNPGAYAHYSYAIHDAVKAIRIPTVEVHISNIAAREAFRASSVIAPACVGQISGLGAIGYILAIEYFVQKGEWEDARN